MRSYPAQSLLCPLVLSPLIHKGLNQDWSKYWMRNQPAQGIYFWPILWPIFHLHTDRKCTLGFGTLCVTHAEMFPDSRTTKPLSHWAVKYHVHSGYLPFTVQDSPTQGRKMAPFLSDLQDSLMKMTVLPQDLLGPSPLTSPGAAPKDNCHPPQRWQHGSLSLGS